MGKSDLGDLERSERANYDRTGLDVVFLTSLV